MTGSHAPVLIAVSCVAFCGIKSASALAQTTPADLVLHAADAQELHGTWQRVADQSAAGGTRLWHPDAGAPKITTAAAAPRDYFELTFDAEAGRAYRLWMRGRAERDFYTNDSVFVQFSASVTAGGAPVYRMGSTEATAVIIENCSGCQLSGWGWQDNEYGGSAPGPAIYFEQPGPQTVRIQGREDGISIDQIVLSSDAYAKTAPGALRNDATILPKTDFTSPPPAQRPVAFTTTAYTAGLLDIAVVRDLNADGRPDLAGIFDNAPITMSSVLNSGKRAFSRAQEVEMWGGPESVRSLELADVTRDGRPDLLFLDASYGRLAVIPGAAGGTFDTTLMRTTPFLETVGDFGVADLNRDGTPDVVTTEPERNAAVTHLGNGDGTFAFLAWVSSGPAPTLIATGDFNADGFTDIATLSQAQRNVYFSIGDGTGRFPRQASVATGALPVALAVRDLNRDGFDDIAIANRDGTVTVNMATSAGSFEQARHFVSSRIAGMSVREDGLAIADVNGDAHPDLLVQHYGGSAESGLFRSIGVLYGAGDGSFSAPENFGGRMSGPIITGDLDGDGRQDVLLPDSNAGFSVMWNDPADANRPPVAHAGADSSVAYSQQTNFRLSSGQSFDPDSHTLTYSWTDSSGAQFSTGPFPKPFASPREPGTYTFTLTVDDLHGGRSSDSVTVAIADDRPPTANRAPTVDAFASLEGRWPYERQFQDQPDTHTFLSSTATDPDGDSLTYEWRDAEGLVVGTNPTYRPPSPYLAPGSHQFTLIVRDGRGGEARDTASVTVLPFEEIVITAGYKEQVFGSGWERVYVPAEGAAYDIVVRDPNAGAPKINEPLASPPSHVEFAFPADPTLEYKLWIRLKAQNDYWGNDSLWVQFSGAVDARGNPVFRTGTNAGLWVNLEECSSCGISGWGWRDDAWGAPGIASSTLLRFPAGGLQTLRIQRREDGVSIDQIVLSAVRHKTTRPGAVRNDTTKLTMTAEWGH